MDVVLALDVGGTKILGALVGTGGQVLHTIEAPTPHADGVLADPELAATAAVARQLCSDARERDWQVSAVGAGFPEYVDPGGRLTSHEVLAWTEQPAELLARIGPAIPCTIESDVRCGAVAEWRLGAGSGRSGLLYVSLGTGLSCAAIVDGRLIRGTRGEAIGFGELDVEGWAGNLESYASGAGIAARYGSLDTRRIVQLAERGDAAARAVLESAGAALGAAISGLVAVLDPPLVVLGGGLGSASTPLHDALVATYRRRASRRTEAPELLRARLGSRAGVIGAALLAGAE